MSQRLQSSLSVSSTNKPTTPEVKTGVVVDVILDTTHKRIKAVEAENLKKIFTEKDAYDVYGVVVRPYNDKTTPTERLQVYKPASTTDFEIPIIGEVVELVTIGGVDYYQRTPASLLSKGSAEENRAQTIFNEKEKENKGVKDYSKTSQTGTVTDTSATADKTQGLGTYYKHNPVNRLKIYEGDKLIQSRFGQSIRFSGYNNANNAFSPTIIIRNRQNSESLTSLKEGDLTEEEVNKDGSVIVMSSGEYQIPFTATTSIGPNKFGGYPNPLKGDDHLLINSGKIILSAKTGEMVFHSKGNYGFISDGKFSIDNGQGADLDFGGDVNITTDRNSSNVLVKTGSGKIFLNTDTSGKSPNTDKAAEPLVRGNTLKDLLEEMIDLIVEQVYRTPSGPTAIGPENKNDFQALKARLKEMLSTQNFTE
jgi:hypothetical protein